MMLDFLGRLHPLVLHLPIGILALAYSLELFIFIKKKDYREVQSFILLLAALSATISVLTGLMLVRGGDYGGNLVGNHKWVAIALSIVAWGLYFLTKRKITRIYYLGLIASAALLLITGHLGGSITHGEDFLTKSNALQVTASIEEAGLYVDIIEPIFDKKCYSCHNPSKLKGELDMTSFEGLQKGGEEGSAILANNNDEALLLKRIHLPLDNDDHMPPESKPQLNTDEIALIEWWIKSGADFEKAVIDVDGFEEHKSIAERFLAPPETNVFTYVPPVDSIPIRKLKERGYKLYPFNAGSPAVYVNFSNNQDIKARNLTGLRSIKNNIAHLNLASSSVSDSDLAKINRFKHLEKLELQNTGISSKGITKLRNFQFLKTLNLFNTKVDSSAMEKILSFPQLRNVYLWKTEFTPEQITKMRAEKPRLNVVYAIASDKFNDVALKPPTITADQDVFNDSMEVSLNLSFKGVKISYLVNDSDTLVYEAPFKIKESSQIKAFASKDGWKTSPIAERTFVMVGKKINEVKLSNRPHQRYDDFAEDILINNKLGSPRFNDGQWVGYEGEHAQAILQLEDLAEVSEVNIGALERTESYIFYPKGISIEVSSDGKVFEKVVEKSYDIVDGPSSAGRKLFNLNFEARDARYIKIDVLSHLKNPEWHAAPGAKNWIFIDEILVN